MSDAHTDQSRAEFEHWVMRNPRPGTHLDRSRNGEYKDNRVKAKWGAWQAALNYAIASNPAETASAETGLRDCVIPTTEQSSGVELPEPVAHINQNGVIHEAGYDWRRDNYLSGLYTEQQVRALLAGVKDSLTVAPAVPQGWIELTDEDRDRAFNSLPDMLDGFLKKWGWLHFAKAIEQICHEKNSPQPPKEQTLQWCNSCGEGVTTFCRGKTDNCARGLPLPGKEQT